MVNGLMPGAYFEDILSNVSRETLDKLKKYQDHLFKWNKSINLIGPIEYQDIWERHILDSLQLLFYLPTKKCDVADLGSGAGLPGAVLAMATVHHYTLIDKNYKKSAFLRFVSRETLTPYTVCNEDFKNISTKFDIVVSRALMSCIKLYELSLPVLKDNGFILLLKGETANNELNQLCQNFDVTYEQYPSITNSTSSVIKIFKGK